MKKQILFFLTILLGAILIAGCCSIIHGTKQEIGLSSSPSGASVTVNGQQMGTTPVTLDLKRNGSHKIAIEMEGYQPYEITLTKSVSGWVWGNVLFGGLIGLAVDAIDGAIYKLKPDTIQAQMLKSEVDSITIEKVDDIPEGAEKIGQMKKTPAEKLKELKELKDKGILTEEEYETKRKILVDQLE